MTNEERIIVIQGYIDGKKIAYRCKGYPEWVQAVNPSWDFNACDYKIANREYWANVYLEGIVTGFFASREDADKRADSDRTDCLHLVEKL